MRLGCFYRFEDRAVNIIDDKQIAQINIDLFLRRKLDNAFKSLFSPFAYSHNGIKIVGKLTLLHVT